VYGAEIQPDGKILVGGVFDNFNGVQFRPNVARLNTDGSVDTSFVPVGTGGADVEFFAVQPDGKILVSGFFGNSNATSAPVLRRLNTNGAPDSGFNAANG